MKTATLLCQCQYNILDKASCDALQSQLEALPTQVVVIDDLCACSLNDKKRLNQELSGFNEVRVIACYDRVIRNLFFQNNIDIAPQEILSLKEKTKVQIVKEIGDQVKVHNDQATNSKIIHSSLKVPAWFPIIEQSACSSCGQCADFCLFGVYQHKNKSLKVQSPLSCKNNCPACGRTCPSKAIIFPKLKEDSVLAGKTAPKDDQPIVFEGSMLSALNQRNSQRKSILQQGTMEQAHKERDAAIREMKRFPKK